MKIEFLSLYYFMNIVRWLLCKGLDEVVDFHLVLIFSHEHLFISARNPDNSLIKTML